MDEFTSLLRLVLQETGGNQNQWGFINNASAIDLIEDAIAARLDLDVTPATHPVILQADNGAADQARNAIIALTGTPGGTRSIQVPSTSKLYIISNETADVMTIKTSANAGLDVRAGTRVAAVVDPVADDVFEIGFVPAATEDEAGILEVATQPETDAGVLDDKIITPLKLNDRDATELLTGIIAIADQAETDLGTEPNKAITPEKLEGRQATEILTGLMRFATQLEVDTGTEAEAAVTPATLAASFTGAIRGCKAYKTAGFQWPRNDLPGFTIPDNAPGGTSMIVDFNAEVFDTDTIHDNVTQNSRFTIPSGVTKVEFIIGYMMDSTGVAQSGLGHVYLRKNGVQRGVVDTIMPSRWPWNSDANGGGTNQAGAATGEAGMVAWYSGLINITDSDYLEVLILSQGGRHDTPTNGIWAEMRIIE